MTYVVRWYDHLEARWESETLRRLRSNMLLIVFCTTLVLGIGNHFHWFERLYLVKHIRIPDAIEYTFNFILLFEMVALAFVLPQSISNSIGRQMEIMSLILLRTSFEELSHLSLSESVIQQFPVITRMAADAGAALLIFFLVHIFYSLQQHKQITDDINRQRFINLKKAIAVGVLAGLVIFVVYDICHYLQRGIYHPSYALFYLILIFTDMLLLLAAFKYVMHYANLFRYSAYVLITIFIRLALMAPVYYNALLAIGTAMFGIGITWVYNRYSAVAPAAAVVPTAANRVGASDSRKGS